MKDLYQLRFTEEEREWKDRAWRVLCESYFQRYVKPTDRLLELGCGDCHFLRHIRCGEKHGVDARESSLKNAPPDAKIYVRDASELGIFRDGYFDVVFASNLFEHLETRAKLVELLKGVFRVLKGGGRLIILQPNIRAIGETYWDFFDHHIPLTDRSMAEGLEMAGYTLKEVRPRFLPYTTKRKAIKSILALKIFLKMRILQRLFGKQMLIIAEK